MTKDQAKEYRGQLRQLAERLGATVSHLEDQARGPTGGEAAGGISNAPLHLGDVGSEVYTQELGATLLENEVYLRGEVLDALERIDRGTYGRCARCGRDIAPERLDAIPYARHCAPCASELQTGRPVNLNDGRPGGWLGAPGHEALVPPASTGRAIGKDLGGVRGDSHAAGTPGGGTAVGGLAGTTIGDGAPERVNLEGAMGRGNMDDTDFDEEQPEAFSGSAGGAVGGTPANKRARGGKRDNPDKPASRRSAPKAGSKKTGKKRSK
jgi:RNA polymerase-binding transcription factor DksA